MLSIEIQDIVIAQYIIPIRFGRSRVQATTWIAVHPVIEQQIRPIAITAMSSHFVRVVMFDV